LVHGGADSSAGVKDIVDQNYIFTVDVVLKLGTVNDGVCPNRREIVAVKRDIKDAVKRFDLFYGLDLIANAFGKRNTTAANAYKIKILSTAIFLGDLHCEPSQGTLHCRRIHDPRLFYQLYFVCHSREIVTNVGSKFKVCGSKFGLVTALTKIKATMSKLWQKIARPLLFGLDAERAHELGIKALEKGMAAPFYPERAPSAEIEIFGLKFANPLGIAAGFDKNGIVVNQLASLGFGFVEVGTVTYQPQAGNPKPRMFRLPEDRALINRLGFNNQGAEIVAERLRQLERKCVVGLNIGKNKDVPNEEAVENYLASFDLVHPVADYVAVNISSPNTPNLRELQKAESLDELLSALQGRNRELGKKPLLVKIAPDLTEAEIEAGVDVCRRYEIDGIIATNTTISRDGLRTENVDAMGAGGLSGKPLLARSNEVISTIYKYSDGKLPIIGVGGIFTAENAFAKIAAGASLIQAYTGFVYGGPTFARDVNEGLARLLGERGFSNVSDAVGSALTHSRQTL